MLFRSLPLQMTSILKAIIALCFVAAASPAWAQELGPEQLVQGITEEVFTAITADKELAAGDRDKVLKLAEQKVLPDGGFEGATRPAPSPAWPQVGPRETALARISRARAIADDPEILSALRARNAAPDAMAEIQRKDKEWMANPQSPLRKTLSTNACAQRLRELTKEDPLIVEVILMAAKGANVCVAKETSDYWQGDEAKFHKTFGENKDVFVDEPAFDASANVYALQLSVLIKDGGKKAGALTLSLRVPKGIDKP